jgi:DNA-binding transcriptional LysR family regulator
LTDAGGRYLTTARHVLLELELCEQGMRQANDEPKGRVKINLPVSYGRLYVMPLLQGFNLAYPEVELELSFNDGYVDILEQGIDLTIRTGKVDDQRLVARKLCPIDFLICASPQYIKQHGYPADASQFEQHAWIRFRYRQSGKLMPVVMANDPQQYSPGQQFVVDDGEALAELCAQGLGLTQIPHFIARDWLRDRRILPIFPYHRSPDQGVYCIYPKREFLPARVRVLIEYLIAQIEAGGESTYHTWAEQLQLVTQ